MFMNLVGNKKWRKYMSEENENNLTPEEQLERIKKKNEQLLEETKKAKADRAEVMSELSSVKEALKKFENVDLEKYAQIVKAQQEADKNKEIEAAKEKGEIDKLITNLNKTHNEEVEKIKSDLMAQLEQRDAEMNRMIKDNGITAALAKAKIQPVYLNGARALIEGRVYVDVDEDGNKYAAVKVDGEPINVEKYVCDIWATSEEGSAYKSAPSMSGGGASGGNSGTGGIKNPFAKGSENLTQQMKIARENPELARMLMKQAGV